ncbi:hypothetical protein MLD52_10085 [Puniceicoccaceae bacterium K14]|nr:hypothetical protein [Puniceicoccaceae bacterium K14]
MKKNLLSIIFLGFLTCGVAASVPSDSRVAEIKAIISKMAENLEGNEFDEEFSREMSTLISDYGVEGLAWLGYNEPVFLQAMILSPAMGLENISKSLVREASSEDQVESMLVSLMVAQVAVGMDPASYDAMNIYRTAVAGSDLYVDETRLQSIIDASLVIANEMDETGVIAANPALVAQLEALRDRIIALFGANHFLVDFINGIISRVE